MDYDLLLEGCCEMGCRMLQCGAEIHRVEDTVHRLLGAYHIAGEVFAIPNCLIISISDGEGRLHTRMHRAEPPKTDVALIESYNALSRRLCAKPPADPGELLREVYLIGERNTVFPLWAITAGYFLGCFFFALFFGGGAFEAVTAAVAGAAAGLSMRFLDRIQCNFFIATVLSGFLMSIIIYAGAALGLPLDLESTIAGGLMALVPGLVFTYFLSDLLAGDVMAGISTFVRAMLSATAIAIGTCVAMSLFRQFGTTVSAVPADYGVALPVLFTIPACYGFCLTFNIRGKGAFLCCLGGGLGWAVYLLLLPLFHGSVFAPTLLAAIAVSVHSEVMARVRKCPATGYLLVSFLPLVPGLAIYQALNFGLQGQLELFWDAFFRTFGVAGCLALGSAAVTSAVHILNHRKGR